MTIHFADRLAQAVRHKRSRLCVGIDPRFDLLPQEVACRALNAHSDRIEAAAEAYREFSVSVIGAVAPFVPCVKVQVAYFEALGWRGMKAFDEVTRAAYAAGVLVISDCKRGDIGTTSEAYAQAHLGGFQISGSAIEPFFTDAITVNPYMGSDAVAPFVKQAAAAGKGVFVLLRTSNPSSREIQELSCDGRPVWHYMADLIGQWAHAAGLGKCGYSCVGAVVGATCPAELAELRKLIPHVPFLVPGFGAQGGTAADVAGAFDVEGLGAVVNSSRGVLYPKKSAGAAADWLPPITEAARTAGRTINEALGLPS